MYRVILTPECRADIRELRGYITQRSSRRTADRYISRLRKFYERLAIAPYRGEERYDQRPGLRSIGFERRITILFAVHESQRVVQIIGFYYAGKTF